VLEGVFIKVSSDTREVCHGDTFDDYIFGGNLSHYANININLKYSFDTKKDTQTFFLLNNFTINSPEPFNYNRAIEILEESGIYLLDSITYSLFKLKVMPYGESMIHDTLDQLNEYYFTFISRFIENNNLPLVFPFNLPNKDKIFDFKSQSRLNFNLMASGIQAFIKLAYFIFNTCLSMSGDYVKSSKIFFIEEPEQGMHPAYQKLIPSFFREINNYLTEGNIYEGISDEVQFILSTHSPFIISAAAELDGQKVYLIDGGQTVDLAGRPGRTNGFEDDKCLAVASKMLGAGLSDISNHSKLQNKYNVFYCENTDADIYNLIFPAHEARKNIFIGVGGADEVIRAFYTGKEALKIAFGEDTKVFALVDRSCSGGKGLDTDKGYIKTHKNKAVFTNEEKSWFLETNPNYRMLKRKEIENYLFDPEIVNLYNLDSSNAEKIGLNDQIDYNLEVKDKLDKYKDSIKVYKKLAGYMNPETKTYKNLREFIFG
jgi:hypothetical protein